MKIDYSNPRSIQMFNKTCMRGWFHHKKKNKKEELCACAKNAWYANAI